MTRKNCLNILFLTQTPIRGASARYRVYQFLDFLESEGISCKVSPAISDSAMRRLSLRGSFLDRVVVYSQPIIRRAIDMFRLKRYDLIFLQRDILIHFPPIVEWMISRFNKNLIFDFDDALYTFPQGSKYAFFYRLRGKNKIPAIIRMAKHVITGNRHLEKYAFNFNKNVTIIPTCINTDKYLVKDNYIISNHTVIGWIGRPGSAIYLKQIEQVFRKLSTKYNIVLRAVGVKDIYMEGVNIEAKEWNIDDEINDLHGFDIGIMPLSFDEWTKGKSAAKLLQYMAVGIPVVCSAVGANCDIVEDGRSGFLVKTEDEWISKLSLLIEKKELRQRMGRAGRVLVEKCYSLKVNALRLKEVLERVAAYDA